MWLHESAKSVSVALWPRLPAKVQPASSQVENLPDWSHCELKAAHSALLGWIASPLQTADECEGSIGGGSMTKVLDLVELNLNWTVVGHNSLSIHGVRVVFGILAMASAF